MQCLQQHPLQGPQLGPATHLCSIATNMGLGLVQRRAGQTGAQGAQQSAGLKDGAGSARLFPPQTGAVAGLSRPSRCQSTRSPCASGRKGQASEDVAISAGPCRGAPSASIEKQGLRSPSASSGAGAAEKRARSRKGLAIAEPNPAACSWPLQHAMHAPPTLANAPLRAGRILCPCPSR